MKPAVSAPAIFWPRVGVVGVGLIGGSFAAALKRHQLAGRVIGYAPDDSAAQALTLGLIDEAAGDLETLAASVDLIVLAAPVMQLPALLARIAPHLSSRCVITDCASTKDSVIAAAQQHLGAAFARFVPAHPIAGSERSGPTAADAELFDGARLILCPQTQTDPQALEKIVSTWRAIGAHVSELSATEHDRLFAVVSHWPHALAFALSAAIAASDIAVKAQQTAGAGLRDTTRISASSPSLWAEILLDNRGEVLRAANEFRTEFDRLFALLERGDQAGLEQLFSVASQWRRAVREPSKS